MATASPSSAGPPSVPPLYHPADVANLALTYALTPTELNTLFSHATTSKRSAYCPYSRFRVGASILTSSNVVFSGANVENASYPVGTCAERVALGTAVVELGRLGLEGEGQGGNEEWGVGDVMPFTRWRRGGGKEGEKEERKFKALVVVTDAELPASPCGMCRQFIREFCGLDMPIYMFDGKGDFHVLTLGELLPASFGPKALRLAR